MKTSDDTRKGPGHISRYSDMMTLTPLIMSPRRPRPSIILGAEPGFVPVITGATIMSTEPTEVVSPVSRRGSKVGSNPPLTVTHSNPDRSDSVPQPSPYKASKHSSQESATLHVTGPDDD
jgi:hypothetical protein